MGYPHFARIEREVAVNAELERCRSIMAAVGLYVESFRGDHDGFVVELASGLYHVSGSITQDMTINARRRITRGFGTTVCEAFAKAAEEHRQ